MSQQDARKITIMEELKNRHITIRQAAQLLDLSTRQVQRLKKEATVNGVMAVLHKNRGRKPSNATPATIIDQLLALSQSELADYNFCHIADVLAEEKNLFLSVSTVSRYLRAHGLKSPKAKRRPKKHRSRNPRPCEGELAQMDASTFDWLGTGDYLHLHGAIDDATGRILGLHFAHEETFEAYCEVMIQMNQQAHIPREIYTDARSVFVYNSKIKRKLTIAEELAGGHENRTHFARALRQIRVLLIIAGSPQAKGSIERLWGTLQDRLSKDLRRRGISSVEQANAFLSDYIPYYNNKFAVSAVDPTLKYLPRFNPKEFERIFAVQETRKLDEGLAFSYYGQKYGLPAIYNGMKIPASPHDTLTVITSKRVGLQVIFNGRTFIPELLGTQPKLIIQVPVQIPKPVPKINLSKVRLPAADHPWRKGYLPPNPALFERHFP